VLAIIDPFSGVAGDMFLGALVDLGLDAEFISRLPATLGLDGVSVRIARTQRCGIGGVKVDFDIPPQPHGRHLKHILEIVDRSPAPPDVKAKASEAFRLIATIEADVHGTTVERVHLHEVGAVDAILDIVGAVWGLAQLGVTDVRCGPIALGEGFVDAAHGRMPVPAPATARLLEGLVVSPGPPGSGELTTPTGAALVRVLARGPAPRTYLPKGVGYGAGTKEFADRPNLLRITLAESLLDRDAHEALLMLAADIDDMSPEHLANAADELRAGGALDVTLSSVVMKKGRFGTRLEALVSPADAARMEEAILMKTSSIGVRRTEIFRRALTRREHLVHVMGHVIRVKAVRLPDGAVRVKPEFDDVRRVTVATGLSMEHISAMAVAEAQRLPASV
jgi:hypothetical protein